jgi:hypothetical protein
MLLPNMLAWTMRLLPANVRGRGTGLWTGAFFFAQFTAPLIATGMTKQTGGLAGVHAIYGALSALGAAATMMFHLKASSSMKSQDGA